VRPHTAALLSALLSCWSPSAVPASGVLTSGAPLSVDEPQAAAQAIEAMANVALAPVTKNLLRCGHV